MRFKPSLGILFITALPALSWGGWGWFATYQTINNCDMIPGTVCQNMDFSRLPLKWQDLNGSDFSNSKFVVADLSNSNFQNAKLDGANLSSATIEGANFDGASCIGATWIDGKVLSGPCRAISCRTLFGFAPGQSFSKSEVKKKFRHLAMTEHPDKKPTNDPVQKKLIDTKWIDITVCRDELENVAN